MAAKVIYLAGVPASGKTTIFRRLRDMLMADATAFQDGKCKGIERGNLKMIGVFDDSTFEGTDKLSMTAIDDVVQYIQKQEDSAVILIEGDRLFNERFLTATRAVVILIDADEQILKQRHATRDSQSDLFLKGRRTKIENFKQRHPKVRIFWNNNESDSQMITNICAKLICKYSAR